jgi:AAA domain/TrwC relaxase
MMTLTKYSAVVGDHESSRRVAKYLLDPKEAPQAFALPGEGGSEGRANSMWLGSERALAATGVSRGEEVGVEQLSLVMQGIHPKTGATVRTPGPGKRKQRGDAADELEPESARVVRNQHYTGSPPKFFTFAHLMALLAGDEEHCVELEQLAMSAMVHAIEHIVQTKPVVRRRVKGGGRTLEKAVGVVGAGVVHMTARRAVGDAMPCPQLHVHFMTTGVETADGDVVTPENWEMFRKDAVLEAAAVFRCIIAAGMKKMGYPITPNTGNKERFFEIPGYPPELIARLSSRTDEIESEIERVEAKRGEKLTGGALAIIAALTRQPKDHGFSPQEQRAYWEAICQEFEFGPAEGRAVRTSGGDEAPLEERRQEWLETFQRMLDDRGPTVTRGTALATAFEAASNRLDYDGVRSMLRQMEDAGELIALKGRNGGTGTSGRATTRDIREMERHIMQVASWAGRSRRDPLSPEAKRKGLAVANAALGEGRSLDTEQEAAFERLTDGRDWTILTGKAGTGKGPTLQAVAAAHVADGWQVIACAASNTVASRLGEQIGATASSIDQVLTDVQFGNLELDDRTLILVDEASQVRRGLWDGIATLVEEHGVRVLPIGHTGQLDAVTQPGMFAELIKSGSIEVSELQEVRRHRNPDDPSEVHPWLRDFQEAIDDGRAQDAVDLLVQHGALRLYATRQEAMEAMVDDWDVWRHGYDPLEALMIPHGPNTDIDAVNVLAQKKRLAADELDGPGIKAVDRDYMLYANDWVILRNGHYRFEPDRSGRRLRKVANGQIGIVEAVDVERDRIKINVDEPGHPPRSVWLDLAPLREQVAKGEKRTAALRVHYGGHPSPTQGATLDGTAELGGHWSEDKNAAYVSGSRARFMHLVYASLEELGASTEAEARQKLVEQISKSRSKLASIKFELDESTRVTPNRVTMTPVPDFARRAVEEPVAAADAEITAKEARAVEQELDLELVEAEEEAVAEVRREDVEVPDPLRRWEDVFGKRRTDDLRARSLEFDEEIRELDYEGLREARKPGEKLLLRLEPGQRLAAGEIVRFERRIDEANAKLREAEGAAKRLRDRAAEKATKRSERAELERNAAAQDTIAAGDRDAIRGLEQKQETVRQRWDLDAWLAKQDVKLRRWAAAERELGVRRGIEVELAAQQAPSQTPEHVREAIDERPARGAEERERWDKLAQDLERNRMRAVLQQRDGVEVTVDRREQLRLVEEIRELRELRGLDDVQAQDVAQAAQVDPQRGAGDGGQGLDR